MSTKTTQDKPTPPKRPLSAYFIFMAENREKVRSKHPDKPQAALTKIMAETYRKLNDKERAQYDDKAKKMKAEYEKEFAAYVAKYGQPAKKAKKTSSSGEKKKVKKGSKEDAEPDSGSEAAVESEEEKELSNPKVSKGKKQVQPKVTKK